MLKLEVRENMKSISRFLLVALVLCGGGAYAAAPVATTLGSNLTAYNGNSGATNNAMWNSYVNARSNSAASAPTADFGNCNALILRCAQPKCANGGCTSLEVARPIVSGCVESNSTCKQYGDDLIEYISAQLVATSTANANQAAADAQIAAAQAAAQQSAQQMAQMQQQMSQMQQQMQQQSADTAAQIQAALAQQQQATSQAIADAAAASSAAVVSSMPTQNTASGTTATTATGSAGGIDLTAAQQVAAASGVSADLLAREQISGQILTKIENAEVALKSAKAAMETAFAYAGCNSTGSNCTGPKRVSTFKNKAMQFFDPYNDVLDEVYDALILAQSVGVDITDIYMMLNGTCNAWGQYLCSEGQVMHYTAANCIDGKSVPVESGGGTVYGGANCKIGQVVPMSDGGCQLIKVLEDDAEVQRNWLYPEEGIGGVQVRVGCASEILDNSMLFRNRKKQADIDIEVLQRMIEQDAPSVFGGNRFGQNKSADPDGLKYCALTTDTFQDLQKYASLKQLPKTVCVPDDDLEDIFHAGGRIAEGDTGAEAQSVMSKCASLQGYQYLKCLCDNSPSNNAQWKSSTNKEELAMGGGDCICPGSKYDIFDYDRAVCVNKDGVSEDDTKYMTYVDDGGYRKDFCEDYESDGAKWNAQTLTCDCSGISSTVKKTACETLTEKDSESAEESDNEESTSSSLLLCATTGGTTSFSSGDCMCGYVAYNPSIQRCATVLGQKTVQYKL